MENRYKNVVTTLFEKHYEYGVAGLLNSLSQAGYEGIICIGYKGKLPFWINQLQQKPGSSHLYQLSERIDIRFDELKVDMHFGYYKPYYLRQMAREYPGAHGWFYFDPDIVVLSKWSFYENWIISGAALCQDSNFTLLYWNHPWRNQWRKDFEALVKGIDKTLNYYINSGFIGVNKSHFELVERWIEVNEQYKALSYPIHFFDQSNTLSAYKGDQDVLNATMTINSNIVFSILGKEGMAFDFPHAVMAHAVDGAGIKPWKRNYIKNALLGNKSSVTDERYLDFCSSPIEIYSRVELNKKRRLLKISKVLNRIWKK